MENNPFFNPNNGPILGSRMLFANKHRFKSNVKNFAGQKGILR